MIGTGPAPVKPPDVSTARRRAASLALSLSLAAAADVRAQECDLVLAHPPQALASAPEPAASPGPPRIRSVRFAGQRAVSASRLRARMHMKAARFWRSRSRSAYSQARWAEDHRRLCDLYREGGYVTASVGPPEVVTTDRSRRGHAVSLLIPVQEGPRYETGRLDVAGVTGWDEDAQASTFDLRPGKTYRHDRVRRGLEALRREAGRRGHATWSALVTLTPRPQPGGRLLVDVSAQVQEGPPWLVGRIGFRGTRKTRDPTLRRALVLDEGTLLDTDALEESVRRLDALGYVRVRDVEIAPSPRADASADVTFLVEERPSFRYGLSGGVNALEGASLAAEVGEVNALGRGERVFASVQLGQDVEAYELSGALPHVLGSAWTAGVRARAHRLDLEGVPQGGLPPYVRDAEGFALFAGRPLGRRARLGFDYSLADVTLTAATGAPPPGFGRRRDGRLAVSLRHDGWDHGWKPRRGLRAEGQARAWGGPLGGSVEALELRARVFGLAQIGQRAALGAGAQGGVIRSGHGLAELPFDERYLLGGETQLRGFDVRSAGPLDEGGALVAGTRFLVLHGEAHLDLPHGARALAFADAGKAWAEAAAGRYRVSTGLEVRFELPVLHVPLRLIGALNPARDPFHPRASFRVAVGPVP